MNPPEARTVFMPVDDGYPSGFSLSMGSNLQRLYQTNLYYLLGPEGSVDQFLGAIGPGFREGVLADLERMVRPGPDPRPGLRHAAGGYVGEGRSQSGQS